MDATFKNTSKLLSELDRVIDQSSVMRDIVNRCEQLQWIESITGPSRQTRIMREEIEVMKSKLKEGNNEVD